MVFSRSLAFRAATHLATWMPFLYGAASAVRHNWRPISDNAGIAIRSWDVFTSYGPLLGQPSRLARGVYDLGPLQYWLLSVPVHIDPRAGALWGAALCCMLACSLTIEAARSAAGAAGGLLACAALLAAILWIPGITRQPLWNPWFGLMFFMAALATAWAVMAGRRGWWPVLMVTASVAAQAHLMYAVAAGGLVLLALAVALTETIRSKASYRWLIIGAVAGLACWSAPLLQQFTTQHGNLAAILSNSGGSSNVAKGGYSFGLQAVAASVQPPPVWWTSFPQIRTVAVAAQRPAAVGVVMLVAVAAILIAAAGPLRSRRTWALAAISLLVSLAAVYTYAAVPAANISQQSTTFNSLTYLMAPMLPLGLLAWFTIISGVVIVARKITATRPAAAGETGAATGPAARLLRADWALPAGALAAVAVIAVVSVLAIAQNRGSEGAANSAVDYYVRVASAKIQARLPGQPIQLTVLGRDNHYRRKLTFGLAYALNTMGYRPEVRQNYAWQLGPAFSYQGAQIPLVTVRMRSGGVGVVVRTPRASLTRRGTTGS